MNGSDHELKRSILLKTFNENLHNQRKDNVDAIKKAVVKTANSTGLSLKPEDVPEECCRRIAHVRHDSIKVNDYVVGILSRVGVPIRL
jgi:hypothetical protein